MLSQRTIALDCMGGDHGPHVVIPGAALSLKRHPALDFVLCGDEKAIGAELENHAALAERSKIIHTETAVSMTAKPSQALRRGKGTSMWMAIEAVKNGEAHVAVSAGNTGALMAMSKLILRPMSAIERPAIAALWPTVSAECIVLDVGANIGANARQLADFAVMGAAMARALFHTDRPTVGLLNVGTEEIKGDEEVKQANQWLKDASGLPLDYRGFVEGDQIGHGVAD
ncbi:MAG: phosphate acyltransferase, partial [Pseudomonadota bacterium]